MRRANKTVIVFLAAWPLYYLIVLALGGLPPGAWMWTFILPVAASGLGWLVLSRIAPRFDPTPLMLVFAGAALAAVDQFVKLLVRAVLGWERAVQVLPDAFELALSPNRHGSYIASLLDVEVAAWVYLLAYPLIAWLTFGAMGFYQSRHGRTGWLCLARLFLTAGLVAATADRIFWDFTLDWVVIEGLFAFDLKDVFLNLAVLSCVSDLVANERYAFRLSYGLRDDLRLAVLFARYLVGRGDPRQERRTEGSNARDSCREHDTIRQDGPD